MSLKRNSIYVVHLEDTDQEYVETARFIAQKCSYGYIHFERLSQIRKYLANPKNRNQVGILLLDIVVPDGNIKDLMPMIHTLGLMNRTVLVSQYSDILFQLLKLYPVRSYYKKEDVKTFALLLYGLLAGNYTHIVLLNNYIMHVPGKGLVHLIKDESIIIQSNKFHRVMRKFTFASGRGNVIGIADSTDLSGEDFLELRRTCNNINRLFRKWRWGIHIKLIGRKVIFCSAEK